MKQNTLFIITSSHDTHEKVRRCHKRESDFFKIIIYFYFSNQLVFYFTFDKIQIYTDPF